MLFLYLLVHMFVLYLIRVCLIPNILLWSLLCFLVLGNKYSHTLLPNLNFFLQSVLVLLPIWTGILISFLRDFSPWTLALPFLIHTQKHLSWNERTGVPTWWCIIICKLRVGSVTDRVDLSIYKALVGDAKYRSDFWNLYSAPRRRSSIVSISNFAAVLAAC